MKTVDIALFCFILLVVPVFLILAFFSVFFRNKISTISFLEKKLGQGTVFSKLIMLFLCLMCIGGMLRIMYISEQDLPIEILKQNNEYSTLLKKPYQCC